MTTKASNVVYLTPADKAERDTFFELLAPHSWADGEHGLMLTDVAFEDCVMSLPPASGKNIAAVLNNALEMVRKTGAGDVCLNSGVLG